MTVFHRRVKMVSFRLSDEEYRQARQTCLNQGFRSISALARAATVRTLEEGREDWEQERQTTTGAGVPYGVAYPDLEARLNELAQVLARVTMLLDRNVSSPNRGTTTSSSADSHHAAAIAVAAGASH